MVYMDSKIERNSFEFHFTECSNQPADIRFLIHQSRGVGKPNIRKNFDFVDKFVDDFDIGNNSVKISSFAFNTSIGDGFYFNCCYDKISIKSNVDNYNSGRHDFKMALNFAKKKVYLLVGMETATFQLRF